MDEKLPPGHWHPIGVKRCWDQVPPPWWWHRCRPHCSGRVYGFTIQRCSCGARREGIPAGHGPWLHRNARRISDRNARRSGV